MGFRFDLGAALPHSGDKTADFAGWEVKGVTLLCVQTIISMCFSTWDLWKSYSSFSFPKNRVGLYS